MASTPTKNQNQKPARATAPSPAVQAPRHERRQEMVKKRRDERMKQYERNRRQWLITKIVAGILLLAIVGGLAYWIIDWGQDRNLNVLPDGVVNDWNYTGGDHNDTFTAWTETPPVGGTHNNAWQNCGFYDKPINTGHGVHSLEHGAVWITYRPDLPQDQIDKLEAIADDNSYVLVSPYEGLPAPIVASSWNRQMTVESADDERLKQYARYFTGKRFDAEYVPEPGARCDGSTDATVG